MGDIARFTFSRDITPSCVAGMGEWGIPIDRGSDRPIIEKGPLDRGSDRPIIEKGPLDRGSDRPIFKRVL